MRRLTTVILVLILIPASCYAAAVNEFGFHVNLDRLGTLSTNVGLWHASVEVYLQTELDSVWQVRNGLGFDFSEMSPVASIALLRSFGDSMRVEADLALKWIPRYGIVGTIDTGFGYYPMISEQSQLILEMGAVTFEAYKVDDRRLPFSLFVGNGWYFTAGQFTTRAGYRL